MVVVVHAPLDAQINIVDCDDEILLFSFPRFSLAAVAMSWIDSGRRSASRDVTWPHQGTKAFVEPVELFVITISQARSSHERLAFPFTLSPIQRRDCGPTHSLSRYLYGDKATCLRYPPSMTGRFRERQRTVLSANNAVRMKESPAMTRQERLSRIKRQIQMGIYESDDKWKITLPRLVADARSFALRQPTNCGGHEVAAKSCLTVLSDRATVAG